MHQENRQKCLYWHILTPFCLFAEKTMLLQEKLSPLGLGSRPTRNAHSTVSISEDNKPLREIASRPQRGWGKILLLPGSSHALCMRRVVCHAMRFASRGPAERQVCLVDMDRLCLQLLSEKHCTSRNSVSNRGGGLSDETRRWLAAWPFWV